jgi:hypothetical protein
MKNNVYHIMNNCINMQFISKMMIFSLIMFMPLFLVSCDDILENLKKDTKLSESEVAEGLKEALKVGTINSVAETNREDGFFGNSLIKIPWPAEAQGAYNYIKTNNTMVFLRPVLDEVVLKMNRGAEQASEKAKPIFIDAITGISIMDAWNILRGANNAATMYLKDNTYTNLQAAFRPDIVSALQSVGAATAWSTVTSGYNQVANNPFLGSNLDPINTDLADYTTGKALDGLFLLVAAEELKIRTDPVARINDILRKVFGQLDQ